MNEKLICAFRWSILSSIMKMHGPKNKTTIYVLSLIGQRVSTLKGHLQAG